MKAVLHNSMLYSRLELRLMMRGMLYGSGMEVFREGIVGVGDVQCGAVVGTGEEKRID
jgi:hypothetical protein